MSAESSPSPWPRRQALLLRLGAAIEWLALPWVFVPREWMERSHEWLGMGAMPAGTVVDFSLRQSSLFYALHGVLLWRLASDVVRYQPIVRLIGWTYLLFGPAFWLIDWTSGTPAWWTWCDPAAVLGFGLLVLWCSRHIPPHPAEFS